MSKKQFAFVSMVVSMTIYNIVEAYQEYEDNKQYDELRLIKIIGDRTQVALPIFAFSIEIINNDEDGQYDFLKAILLSFCLTHVLKYSVNATRPNGGNRSFPSGHTSSAFQGASFIHKRHGLKKAIPAYLAASFVGYSRVVTKKHHLHDVLVGAAIGYLSSNKQLSCISKLTCHVRNKNEKKQ